MLEVTMPHLYFDTETSLIEPGLQAPPLTCVSHAGDGQAPGLMDHKTGVRLLETALTYGWDITGHFVPYDLLVVATEAAAQGIDLLPAIFAAYDAGRIHDTKIRQQIIDIARGQFRGSLVGGVWRKRGYTLADLAQRHMGITLDKDTWRLRYGELRGVPLEQWDPGARQYAIDDAATTSFVAQAQDADVATVNDVGLNERAQWALHLMSAWGVRTTETGVRSLAEATAKEIESVRELLISEGLLRREVKKKTGEVKFTRDTKATRARMEEVCKAEGKEIKTTPTGAPCLDEDACKESEDPILVAYAHYGTLSSVLSKDIPALSAGCHKPIHSRYDMAESSRTTSAKPNVQNWRRLRGVRECFVPRAGMHFAQADYSAFELVTLAQTCLDLFGASALAEILRSGKDPHTALAADLLHITYLEGLTRKKDKQDQEFDDARQLAKAANFGFPGGLGVKTFRIWAKAAYNVRIELDAGYALKAAWLKRYPEMEAFFAYVDEQVTKHGSVTLPRGGLICGDVSFTKACNRLFQGPAARAAKTALYDVTKACYVTESSPLYDSRPVLFCHDEIIMESPIPVAPEAAEELSRVMCESAQRFFPDVPVKAEPCVMSVWSKAAATIRDDSGRLVAWKP